jgi:hypothetical protein
MLVAARAGYVAIDAGGACGKLPPACPPPHPLNRCNFRYAACMQVAARAGYAGIISLRTTLSGRARAISIVA